MKKLVALLLCMCLLATSAAFAEEVTSLNKDVMEGNTNVSLTIDPEDNSFVVVIPASVTVDPVTQEGYMDIVLKAGWKLPSSNGLNVRIKEFANGPKADSGVTAGNTYFLKLVNSEEQSANYRIAYSNLKSSEATGYNYLGNNNEYSTMPYWKTKDLIHVDRTDSNAEDIYTSLRISVPTLPTDPGEYTDTITFVINLE